MYTGYGADKVYVRDLSSGNVLGTLPPMTSLKVYAKLGNWLVIGYNGGYAETYYTHVKSGTPTVLYTGYGVDDIYVRDLSDGHHLTTLPKNTSVKVYAVLGNWLVIGYNGGYAKTYYTHVQKGTPPTSTATSNAVSGDSNEPVSGHTDNIVNKPNLNYQNRDRRFQVPRHDRL
ncbi:hypothetical protein QS257_17920 [Terrilactibacillus sp. S3-3]|nr:hypothetical protein QS257_17920 [Terrilactibacillus sp. S3-3]